MNEWVAIALTVILIALFIFSLVKKFNNLIALLLLSLGGLLIFTIVTGTSVLADKGIGNSLLDVFQMVSTTLTAQLSGALVTILVVLGYVGYMNHLGASDRFAALCTKPVAKLKNPVILCSAVILLGFLFKLAIPSATSLAALLLATLYPVLRKAGISPMTSASCIAISTLFIWGPADTMTLQIFTVTAGASSTFVAPTVSEFFASNHLPVMAVLVPFTMIAFPAYSMVMDKRAVAKAAARGDIIVEEEVEEMKAIGTKCPAIYAILPLLPLVFVIVFGKLNTLIEPPLNLSVVGAVFLAFVISMVFDIIHTKSPVKMSQNAGVLFDAMAEFLKNGGWLIIPAALFATTIDMLGGVDALVQMVTGVGGNGVVLIIVGCLLLLPVIICTGSVTATIALAAPLCVSIAGASDLSIFTCFSCVLVLLGIGTSMCPVHPETIMLSTTCKVDLMELVFRNAPIALSMIVVGIAASLVLLPMFGMPAIPV